MNLLCVSLISYRFLTKIRIRASIRASEERNIMNSYMRIFALGSGVAALVALFAAATNPKYNFDLINNPEETTSMKVWPAEVKADLTTQPARAPQ